MATGWRGQYYRYRDFFLNVVSLYKRRKDLRAFLELALSLSTVIIFTIFALKPTILTIISLYNQINGKRETLNLLNQKISALQKADNIFSQNQNFIPNVDAAVFSNPEPDTVSRQILGLAAKDEVSLLGISIGQVMIIGKNSTAKNSSDIKPLPENAQAMPVSISLKGNYSNLLTFIKDLENLRIPIKVDSLTISASQTQEGGVIVGIITVRVPFLGQT
jgi:Tfp pilus assembly protein PilO